MASPSRPPTYADYDVQPFCSGCGRRFPVDYGNVEGEERFGGIWFSSFPVRGVWGFDCCALTNRVVREAA